MTEWLAHQTFNPRIATQGTSLNPISSHPLIPSNKELYPHCLVLIVPRNGFRSDDKLQILSKKLYPNFIVLVSPKKGLASNSISLKLQSQSN